MAVLKVVVGIVHVPRDKCIVILAAAVQALYFVTGQLFFLRSKMMLAVKMINQYDINITHKPPFLIFNYLFKMSALQD